MRFCCQFGETLIFRTKGVQRLHLRCVCTSRSFDVVLAAGQVSTRHDVLCFTVAHSTDRTGLVLINQFVQYWHGNLTAFQQKKKCGLVTRQRELAKRRLWVTTSAGMPMIDHDVSKYRLYILRIIYSNVEYDKNEVTQLTNRFHHIW